MQLTASNRREVIEDLLDIKIFSSMNNLIKDKIRLIREEIKTFELKKESLNDKVGMQENFIDELEQQGKGRIEDNKVKITTLLEESNNYVLVNNELENDSWHNGFDFDGHIRDSEYGSRQRGFSDLEPAGLAGDYLFNNLSDWRCGRLVMEILE